MAEDAFKKEFKRFKRPSVADMEEVIDPSNSDQFPQLVVRPFCEEALLHKMGCSTDAAEELGLSPPHLWQMFEVESIPGSVIRFSPVINGSRYFRSGTVRTVDYA